MKIIYLIKTEEAALGIAQPPRKIQRKFQVRLKENSSKRDNKSLRTMGKLEV